MIVANPPVTMSKVAMLGSYAPRRCGIATFATHLSEAIGAEMPELGCLAIAMNEPGTRHAYGPRVEFEIAESEIGSYRRAADFLNVNAVDVLSVQHEYGIFGGKAGSHVLALLRGVRMPVVTTLHTILAEPNPAQRLVMDELTRISERLVVMSSRGVALLQEVHGVPASKIDLIQHGIPDVPVLPRSKRALGVEGKWTILTFGLLSPDKGIENVIDAMPAILARYPNVVYVVLGTTHPHVKAENDEIYRRSLELRAQRLKVDGSMIFHDRFVSETELVEFLSAADIYVTPYLKPEQSTSGTLAYAVGSGKAVISTPYAYARELLADGRGVLVPWRDPQAIAAAVNELISDDERRLALCQQARSYGRKMLWPVVANHYARTFERAHVDHAARLRTSFQAMTLANRPAELPEIRLDHLQVMTDSTGLLQHAAATIPRYEDGYCLDDNARALLLMALLEDSRVEDSQTVRTLASRYLAFVNYAFNVQTGRFRNFMSFSRSFLDESGSEDCHGRALWALGAVVGRARHEGRRSLGNRLFHAALPAVMNFSSPRAWAYTLLGIDEYLRAFAGQRNVEATRKVLSERLADLLRRSSARGWPWFEDRLTYANARLPQALFVSGAAMGNEAMVKDGLRSLEWLLAVQRSDDGYFAPVGSNGFFVRGEAKAAFDQQPIEACAIVSACLDAGRVTGDARWLAHARCAFDWFLGQNQLQEALYDATNGGCCDGLHEDRRNENQGAESTLSFLLALSEMRLSDRTSACADNVQGVSRDDQASLSVSAAPL
jgi:glycosyltransferase involved in cell wall biosynthesis